MANFFKNIFKTFSTFPEDDDDDEYDDYVNEVEEKALKEKTSTSHDVADEDYTDSFSNTRSTSKRVTERQSKIVPLRSSSRASKDLEVTVIKPDDFSDCQEICDRLLEGKATIINLVGFDDTFAQRIMDFVSGAVYVVDGKLQGIDNYIFIACPANVDISGDYLELVAMSNNF